MLMKHKELLEERMARFNSNSAGLRTLLHYQQDQDVIAARLAEQRDRLLARLAQSQDTQQVGYYLLLLLLLLLLRFNVTRTQSIKDHTLITAHWGCVGRFQVIKLKTVQHKGGTGKGGRWIRDHQLWRLYEYGERGTYNLRVIII